MKFATYRDEAGAEKLGLMDATGGMLINLDAAARRLLGRHVPEMTSMLAFIEGGEEALALARTLFDSGAVLPEERVVLSATTLLAPLPLPPQIRDCMSFEQHLRDGSAGMTRLRARLTGDTIPQSDFVLPNVFARSRFTTLRTASALWAQMPKSNGQATQKWPISNSRSR